MQIGRLNWTWPTYSLSVNNTDWTNLWVLTLAALGGGLVGAGAASLKPSDFDIFNIFKPQGPSGTQGKKKTLHLQIFSLIAIALDLHTFWCIRDV